MLFIYYLCFIVKRVIERKRLKKSNIIYLILIITGLLLTMLAPGNFYKADKLNTGYSIMRQMLLNYMYIIEKLVSYNNRYFVIVLLLFSAILSAGLILKKQKFWAVCFISLVFSVILLLAECILISGKTGLYEFFANNLSPVLFCILFSIFLALMVFQIIILLIRSDALNILFLFIGAVASIGALLFVPYIVERMFLPFIFVLLIVFCFVFKTLMEFCLSARTKLKIAFITAFIMLVCVIVGSNLYSVFVGYRANAGVHLYNDRLLKQASVDAGRGDIPAYVILKTIKNTRYSTSFPEYTAYYLHEYYDIPNETYLLYSRWDIDKEDYIELSSLAKENGDTVLREYLKKVRVKE